MTPHQATLPQTPVAPRRHRLLATTTFAALLVSAGCVKQPGGASPTERAGLFDNSAWITSGSAAQFTIPGVSWTCIVDIASVNGDDSLYSGNDDQPSYATVSGSVTCGTSGNWAPAYFTQAAVPGEFAAQTAGGGPPVRVKFWRTANPPQVNVSVATDCAGQCPGSSTGTPSTTPGGGPSSLLSGLGAKWIASPGAAQFQVALSSQGTRECWVYVTAVADSRQAYGGDDYPTEARVSGEVYCAPYAPVVFDVSVPSDRYAELRPRDLNQDGPPVLLTFWSTTPQPLQANISVAADCPNGTCPPAPGTTPAPVTPGLGNGGSLSGTDTVFNPAKHWYLCQDGIDSEGQVTFCDRATRNCVRDASIGGSALLCLTTQQLATQLVNTAPNGNTFRECALGDGRFGWQYRSPQGTWYECQAPGNKPGECGWVFGQLETLWSEWRVGLGVLPPAAQQQRQACTERGQATEPSAPAASTGSYAAAGTSGAQTLCSPGCSAGQECVFAVNFGVTANGKPVLAERPACRPSSGGFQGFGSGDGVIGYQQCTPYGATGPCGVARVTISGRPASSPCTAVSRQSPLDFAFTKAGLARLPACGYQSAI